MSPPVVRPRETGLLVDQLVAYFLSAPPREGG